MIFGEILQSLWIAFWLYFKILCPVLIYPIKHNLIKSNKGVPVLWVQTSELRDSANEHRRQKAWKEFCADKQWLGAFFPFSQEFIQDHTSDNSWGSTGCSLGSDQNIKYYDRSVSQTYTLVLASSKLAAAASSTTWSVSIQMAPEEKLICWPLLWSSIVLERRIINCFNLPYTGNRMKLSRYIPPSFHEIGTIVFVSQTWRLRLTPNNLANVTQSHSWGKWELQWCSSLCKPPPLIGTLPWGASFTSDARSLLILTAEGQLCFQGFFSSWPLHRLVS